MNTSVEGIIVNNCQYAPIYLIQDPGATQANTYVLTPSNVEQPKPISNNLKSFYENSGSLENGIVNTESVTKLNVVKKKESILIGNNLKLASFLMPRNDNINININKQYLVDNIVLKPTTTTTANPVNHPSVNTLPKIDMDRKIVKLKEVPIIRRPEKVLPKIKPKENTPSSTQSKHTSVQLIKLGETYHSLNHLSDEQIKMVNQALKMFKDPDKTAPEPTYDPVTNTKYIYKVVSPKDLTVVAKKKLILKDKMNHVTTKIPKRIEEKIVKPVIPKEAPIFKEDIEDAEPPAEAKVTRSGRKVKLPKQILTQDSPQKVKKKYGTIITCFQCSAVFGSLYRLQKHYENHPTHIPAKIHSNLFHCLLAIIKGGSEGNKTNIFIQQLQQLIVKLKSLLPCLLKKVDGSEGQACTINEDIGRLFGMNPGKYNIDVEALNCVKDKDGNCKHNPPKMKFNKNQSKPTHYLLEVPNAENETENCARINSVAKWPTVSKRLWKLKQKTHEHSAKKMRLKSEGDTHIELGTEDFIFHNEINSVNSSSVLPENNNKNSASMIPDDDVSKLLENPQEVKINSPLSANPLTESIDLGEKGKPKQNYVQFHSAHFDIRSSPIKTSSTVFRKFQINPSKMSNYDVQVIRPLDTDNKPLNNRVMPNIIKNVTISNGNSSLHIPNMENTLQATHTSSSNNLHLSLPNSVSVNQAMLPNSTNGLHSNIPVLNNTLQESIPNSDNGLVNTPNLSNDLLVQKSNSNIMVNSNNTLHINLPSSDNGLHINISDLDNTLNVIPDSDDLHVNLPTSANELDLELPNSNDSLHMPNSNDSLSVAITNTNSLHDLFKDDVDLSCKETDGIDPVLKDWIISTSDKSEDSFTKSNRLIEAALLNVISSGDKSLEAHKNVNEDNDMPSLDSSSTDTRLLSSQGESVLNFLDNLSNDLYPETEIRNNGVDFQLDLFTFHNT